MPDPDTERNAVVDAVCVTLHKAAERLTPDIEPASVYVLAPSSTPIDDGERE